MSWRIKIFSLLAAILTIQLLLLARTAVTARPLTHLRFVNAANVPLADSNVRLLCYETSSGGAPLADFMAGTDGGGYVTTPLPANCHFIAALYELHEQPSGKAGHGPAYWIYATSWITGDDAPVPVADPVMLHTDRPFVLFNVVAGLAWQPAAGNPFLSQLQMGLREASAYLYDLTEGQMAFGPVRVHTGGEAWEGADFRFLAANDKRPSAFVGGIVKELTAYDAGARSTLYAPGAIYLGRFWDGQNAFDPDSGHWATDDAAHTLIHEWAHYALFLYDEYQDEAGNQTYCTGPDNRSTASDASAMDYHYTTSELWHPAAHSGLISPPNCTNTRQAQVHGESDWETLLKWNTIQGLPAALPSVSLSATLQPNSSQGVVEALFGRPPGYRLYLPPILREGPAVTPAISEPTITLSLDESLAPTATLPTQIYILKTGTAGAPDRILHQGFVTGTPAGAVLGSATLLGIDPADRARIFVDRYSTDVYPTGKRFYFPATAGDDLPLEDGLNLTAPAAAWQPSLDAYYDLTGPLLTTMTVRLDNAGSLNSPPIFRYCLPDAAIGCHDQWEQTMTAVAGGGGRWEAVVTPLPGQAELPLYGVIRVLAPYDGEIIRWVQVVGGVGPAHDDGIAPLRDGPVMVDSGSALVGDGDCNRVIVMPAADAGSLMQSLGDSWVNGNAYQGIIGLPLDIDILLPDDLCPEGAPGDHLLPNDDVVLTMFYDQATIDRLGISESNLRILHYSRNTGIWSDHPNATITGLHNELNWLSIGPLYEDGIYAVGWFAP